VRAPFQILAIPYRKLGSSVEFCVLRRSDIDSHYDSEYKKVFLIAEKAWN
jgi:hypothetical protein